MIIVVFLSSPLCLRDEIFMIWCMCSLLIFLLVTPWRFLTWEIMSSWLSWCLHLAPNLLQKLIRSKKSFWDPNFPYHFGLEGIEVRSSLLSSPQVPLVERAGVWGFSPKAPRLSLIKVLTSQSVTGVSFETDHLLEGPLMYADELWAFREQTFCGRVESRSYSHCRIWEV